MQRFVFALAVSLMFAGVALAGPPELFGAVAVDSANPKSLTLGYTYGGGGFFFSEDGGANFGLLCTSAVEPGLTLSNIYGLRELPNGTLHMGLFDGLLRSDPTHCTWTRVPQFAGLWVSGLTGDPVDKDVTYLITSTGDKPNRLYSNVAGSDEWKALGPETPLFLDTVHVVKTEEGKRFYVTAVSPAMTATEQPRYLVRVSDDTGENWVEHEFGSTDGSMQIVAVDPTNPDRVVAAVVRTSTPTDPDDVLFSPSQGKAGTFTKIGQVTSFGGAVFTPDGALFYGDYDQATPALYKVTALGEPPEALSQDYKVGCLSYDETSKHLFVCRDWIFGTADPATGEFKTMLDMRAATEFQACPETRATQMACEAQLVINYCGQGHYPDAPICQGYLAAAGAGAAGQSGGAPISAAGTTGAGAGGTAGSPAGNSSAGRSGAGGAGGSSSKTASKPAKGDGGCSVPGGSGGGFRGFPLAVLGLSFGLALWRRRRSCPRR